MATITANPTRSNNETSLSQQIATTSHAENLLRLAWSIQNQATTVLYVKLGAGCSTTDYTYILSAGTGVANGTGGSIGEGGMSVYTGIITIAGTAPNYSKYELTEQLAA